MLTVGDQEQFFPTMMSNGQTLVYEQWEQFKDGKRKAVYQANVDGSNPRLVWNLAPTDEWRCPLIAGTSCVLRETSESEFIFYELNLGTGRGKELARSARKPTLLGDWSLSPDGNVAALPNHAEQSPSIRLLPLNGSNLETTIHVRQVAQLRGIHWYVDPRGFYAAVYVGKAHRLEFIARNGEVRPLRSTDSDSWIAPRRTARRSLLWDYSLSRNVFVWN